MFYIWILQKYSKSWRTFFDVSIILTIAGITIGVAVLVMAMAGFSGFETSLKRAIIDVVGDAVVYRRGGKIDNPDELKKQMGQHMKQVDDSLMFITQESLVANRGQLSAVALQGIEKAKVKTMFNLEDHVVRGGIDWNMRQGDGGAEPPAFMGKDLAAKLHLKPGDSFKLVMPKAVKTNASDITPMIKTFYVAATLDLGQYQFNSRYIFVDLPVVQEMLGTTKISGLRFKLKNSEMAPEWAKKVQEKIGWSYAAIDWKQSNRNFFSAVEYEKIVMFFVVFIIVIAACFNVTTTLFVSVLKRYRDISLMKTLGARPFDIAALFCLHGLFLGVIGVTLGITSGVFFCFVFEFLQKVFPLLPADIYRLSFVATEVRGYDLLMISGATLLLCFFSTLIPSIRGSFLSPVEGLKYE